MALVLEVFGGGCFADAQGVSDPDAEIDEEAEHGGHEDEREDGGNEESADHYAAEATIELAAGAGHDDEGDHASDAGKCGHEDWAYSGADAGGDCLVGLHARIAHVVECLVDDEDGVVDDDADQDDEAEHG